jgi:hypothetical protein
MFRPWKGSNLLIAVVHKKLICDLISRVSAFRQKLEIFEEDIKIQDFIHFPTILEYKKNSDIDCSMFLSL